MDWENLINILNQQQEYLQEFVRAGKAKQEQSRPGYPYDLERDRPSTILDGVESHHFHPTVPLMAIASAQIEFNKTVITMLTDLDNRKSESSASD